MISCQLKSAARDLFFFPLLFRLPVCLVFFSVRITQGKSLEVQTRRSLSAKGTEQVRLNQLMRGPPVPPIDMIINTRADPLTTLTASKIQQRDNQKDLLKTVT